MRHLTSATCRVFTENIFIKRLITVGRLPIRVRCCEQSIEGPGTNYQRPELGTWSCETEPEVFPQLVCCCSFDAVPHRRPTTNQHTNQRVTSKRNCQHHEEKKKHVSREVDLRCYGSVYLRFLLKCRKKERMIYGDRNSRVYKI